MIPLGRPKECAERNCSNGLIKKESFHKEHRGTNLDDQKQGSFCKVEDWENTFNLSGL